ncbi:uncharacterized protein [Vicugna pacos]|uniref:Uncharacterized protein isoform X2 n=1 Tax=Vicugna pacos TaxID=30538 RepID=A0ABM5DBK7_VICPA
MVRGQVFDVGGAPATCYTGEGSPGVLCPSMLPPPLPGGFRGRGCGEEVGKAGRLRERGVRAAACCGRALPEPLPGGSRQEKALNHPPGGAPSAHSVTAAARTPPLVVMGKNPDRFAFPYCLND